MADSNYTNLGVVEETEFGTTPGSALQLLRRTGGSITPRRSTTTSGEIRSDLRAGKPVRTSEHGEGDVNIEWSYGSFDTILAGMLMEDWTSDVLVDGTTKKSFTFEDQIVDPDISPSQYLIYKGARISSVSMSLALESIVAGSLGVLATTPSVAQSSAGTGSATAASSTDVFNTVDMVEAIEGADSGDTPAALTRIVGVELNLTRDLRPQRELGSLNPFGIGVGRLMVAGSITEHFRNSTMMDAWYAYDDRLLNLELQDAAGNNLAIEIPKYNMVGDPEVSIPGPDDDVLATYNFEAYADVADSALIRLTRTSA